MSSKIYGYARISTKNQSIERQIRNILQHNNSALIVQEIYTGTKTTSRKEFNNLINKVKSGDMIIFDSVSRMSRNATDGFETYRELYNKGVTLVFIKEPHINTDTYKNAIENKISVNVNSGDTDTDTFMNDMFSAINKYIYALQEKQIKLAFEQSEKEVLDLRTRTAEGIETARLSGKQIGQKQGAKITTKKSVIAKEIIRKHNRAFGGSLGNSDTMALAKISKNTFHKYKTEILSELAG